MICTIIKKDNITISVGSSFHWNHIMSKEFMKKTLLFNSYINKLSAYFKDDRFTFFVYNILIVQCHHIKIKVRTFHFYISMNETDKLFGK